MKISNIGNVVLTSKFDRIVVSNIPKITYILIGTQDDTDFQIGLIPNEIATIKMSGKTGFDITSFPFNISSSIYDNEIIFYVKGNIGSVFQYITFTEGAQRMAFINAALTDKSSFAVAVESSTVGVLPGSPSWEYLEVNSISSFGETIGKTARTPISGDRMRRKGSPTSLDSAVGFDTDLTYSVLNKFAKGFFFSSWKAQTSFVPTAVTASGYTVASGGTLPASTLLYARNFSNSTNNGLKICKTSTSATILEITTSTVAETPPASARVDIVGFQGASGDITMNSTGGLISTALDFTTLGLNVGQRIYIGGSSTATTFATSGAGFARVQAIAAHLLTLDDVPSTFTTDAGAGKTIQIFIGSFIRNVPFSSADFSTETYTFEVVYDYGTGTKEYQYPNGNFANTLSIGMNMQDKATSTFSFVGLDTPVPTTSRKSGTWVPQYDTTMLNTTSDFATLSIKAEDGTSIVAASDSVVQNLTVDINNNVTIKKALGSLGGVTYSLGNFTADIKATLYFNSSNAIVAVRDNDTVSICWCLNNEDGGYYFDIPSMTLGGGGRSFAANDTISVELSGMDFKDEFYGFSLGLTKFPYLPI